MFPKLRDSTSPTTPAAIQEFERQRRLVLPNLYKEFLLAANGGVPEEPAFPVQGIAAYSVGVIQVFFGMDARHPMPDLAEIYDFYATRIPRGLIPIADNGGGDYVCLDLRGGRERVAFWDKRHFWGTGEWREGDLYHVANSFEEFLASLRPNPY
jgi:SMI1/KNR4 family protein SUKH-1